jgi:excisionase family DNA binding protein
MNAFTVELTPELAARLERIEAKLDAILPPDVVDSKEAARLLGVAERTVRKMVTDGRLPCSRVNGRIRIRRADIGLAG